MDTLEEIDDIRALFSADSLDSVRLGDLDINGLRLTSIERTNLNE